MFLLSAQFQRERRVQLCSDSLGIWSSGADPAARIGARRNAHRGAQFSNANAQKYLRFSNARDTNELPLASTRKLPTNT